MLTSQEITVILLSLKVALVSILIGVPLAIVLAYFISNLSSRLKNIFNSILSIPLILPPIVTGYILLIIFSKKSLIGGLLYKSFGISFTFNWLGAVLASFVVSFPLILKTIFIGIENINKSYKNVAFSLGTSEIKYFFSIVIPLSINSIIAGGIVGFVRSLGEFGATVTFAGNIFGKTQTIPLAMYTGIQSGNDHLVTRLTIISIVIAFLGNFISDYLQGRWSKNVRCKDRKKI